MHLGRVDRATTRARPTRSTNMRCGAFGGACGASVTWRDEPRGETRDGGGRSGHPRREHGGVRDGRRGTARRCAPRERRAHAVARRDPRRSDRRAHRLLAGHRRCRKRRTQGRGSRPRADGGGADASAQRDRQAPHRRRTRALRSRGHAFCVVLGHVGYYPRHGFLPAPARGLRWRRDTTRRSSFSLSRRAASTASRVSSATARNSTRCSPAAPSSADDAGSPLDEPHTIVTIAHLQFANCIVDCGASWTSASNLKMSSSH